MPQENKSQTQSQREGRLFPVILSSFLFPNMISSSFVLPEMLSFVTPILGVVKVLAASVACVVFLAFAGITLTGSAVALAITTPIFIIFSPILVPATVATAVLTTGFTAGASLGATALGLLFWLLKPILPILPAPNKTLMEESDKPSNKKKPNDKKKEEKEGKPKGKGKSEKDGKSKGKNKSKKEGKSGSKHKSGEGGGEENSSPMGGGKGERGVK